MKKSPAEILADARAKPVAAAQKAAPMFPNPQIGEATLTLLRRGEQLTVLALLSELERGRDAAREEVRPFWEASIAAILEATR